MTVWAPKGLDFFIDEKIIATCYHIVDNLNTIEIQNSEGKEYTVGNVVVSNQLQI